MKLDDLASQLGFRNADALFEVVGKDEYSLRNIEAVLRPAPAAPAPTPEEEMQVSRPAATAHAGKGTVLVVGVESLLTQLAHCCRPAPPDAIGGFVTRGKGVGVHRIDCANFRQLAARNPERIIDVQWGDAAPVQGRACMFSGQRLRQPKSWETFFRIDEFFLAMGVGACFPSRMGRSEA